MQRGVYVIMRKCPTAPMLLGKSSVWNLSVLEFGWIIENLSDEFKSIEKAKKKK